jgi:RimJ/RimL family protein N-acetyltransferase
MIAVQAAEQGCVGLARLESTDGDALRRLFYRLSPDTIYRRFHSPVTRPEQAQPERLLDVDHRHREAVLAVLDGEIVGVARYFRQSGTDSAELAVVVADDWQRQGLATRMVRALGQLALSTGIKRFTVSVQADNRRALGLLRRVHASGATLSQGLIEATVPIEGDFFTGS